MEEKYPYFGESVNIDFLDFPDLVDFPAFPMLWEIDEKIHAFLML